MRVSRLASAPNWRYAIGEIALIVIGVTIALAATSWYEARQERQDEILVLKQLHRTLSEDLQEIEQTWEFTRNREQNLTALVAHLESDLPYTPELGVKFQALLGWRIVSIKTAPFSRTAAIRGLHGSAAFCGRPVLTRCRNSSTCWPGT